VKALDRVSFKVNQAEMVALMGPSGSGKTTLLMICGGLLHPTEGEVTVDGVRITDLTQTELNDFRRRTIGFVFQDFNLLGGLTAEENVEVALNLSDVRPPHSREKARDLLISLGLQERLGFLPKQLSGGERQRVSVARALANDPKVILADEPTGNLDSRTGSEVTRLLRQLAKEQKRTVLVSTHDPRVFPHVDRVLTMEDGIILGSQG